jgi:helicase-like protein
VGRYGQHRCPIAKGALASGCYDQSDDFTRDNWVSVVQPPHLDPRIVRPNEAKLVELCLRERAEGRQTWVFCQMTGKRDLQPRLARLLEREGLRVDILRSGTVDPKEREDWKARNGRNFDVILSHSKLVSTGLDLFSKTKGGHNFSSIVFYETGYDLFTLRQTARRAWRIGQLLDCRVYYLYDQGTMQQRAMALMGKKMSAATALEGKFSTEGLVAMAGEDNAQMALAHSRKRSRMLSARGARSQDRDECSSSLSRSSYQ